MRRERRPRAFGLPMPRSMIREDRQGFHILYIMYHKMNIIFHVLSIIYIPTPGICHSMLHSTACCISQNQCYTKRSEGLNNKQEVGLNKKGTNRERTVKGKNIATPEGDAYINVLSYIIYIFMFFTIFSIIF